MLHLLCGDQLDHACSGVWHGEVPGEELHGARGSAATVARVLRSLKRAHLVHAAAAATVSNTFSSSDLSKQRGELEGQALT